MLDMRATPSQLRGAGLSATRGRDAMEIVLRRYGNSTVAVLPPAVLKPVDELAEVSTNDAAQWGLAATANLVLLAPLLDGGV